MACRRGAPHPAAGAAPVPPRTRPSSGAAPRPARPSCGTAPPPGPAASPGSLVAGWSASCAARGRALHGSSGAPAPPLPPSGSRSRSRRGSGGHGGCGLPVWPPRRSAPSRRMSWMKKEVSGLDWLAAPASLGRGSGTLSIPAARLQPWRRQLRPPRPHHFHFPPPLRTYSPRGSAPRRLPIGRGQPGAAADWPPALQVRGWEGESLAGSPSPLPWRIPPPVPPPPPGLHPSALRSFPWLPVKTKEGLPCSDPHRKFRPSGQ